MFEQLWYFFVFKREVKESVCHYLCWLMFLKHDQMFLHIFTAACLLVKRADMLTDGQTHAHTCVNRLLTAVVSLVLLQDRLSFEMRRHGWSAPFTAHEFAKSKLSSVRNPGNLKSWAKKLMKPALSMWSQLVQFNSGNTHKWVDRFLLNLILPLMFLFLSPCYLFLYYVAILPVADFWWTKPLP